MKIIEIKTPNDLPKYGKYVCVFGIDKSQYNSRTWHVCQMNDLEDGINYQNTSQFFWITEKGTKIDDVTHYFELPDAIDNAKDKLIKLLYNQVINLTVMSKIDLGDNVIKEITRLRKIIYE
jgi:hypothetical protein